MEKSKQIIRLHEDNFKSSEVYVITINCATLGGKQKVLVPLFFNLFLFLQMREN